MYFDERLAGGSGGQDVPERQAGGGLGGAEVHQVDGAGVEGRPCGADEPAVEVLEQCGAGGGQVAEGPGVEHQRARSTPALVGVPPDGLRPEPPPPPSPSVASTPHARCAPGPEDQVLEVVGPEHLVPQRREVRFGSGRPEAVPAGAATGRQRGVEAAAAGFPEAPGAARGRRGPGGASTRTTDGVRGLAQDRPGRWASDRPAAPAPPTTPPRPPTRRLLPCCAVRASSSALRRPSRRPCASPAVRAYSRPQRSGRTAGHPSAPVPVTAGAGGGRHARHGTAGPRPGRCRIRVLGYVRGRRGCRIRLARLLDAEKLGMCLTQAEGTPTRPQRGSAPRPRVPQLVPRPDGGRTGERARPGHRAATPGAARCVAPPGARHCGAGGPTRTCPPAGCTGTSRATVALGPGALTPRSPGGGRMGRAVFPGGRHTPAPRVIRGVRLLPAAAPGRPRSRAPAPCSTCRRSRAPAPRPACRRPPALAHHGLRAAAPSPVTRGAKGERAR